MSLSLYLKYFIFDFSKIYKKRLIIVFKLNSLNCLKLILNITLKFSRIVIKIQFIAVL